MSSSSGFDAQIASRLTRIALSHVRREQPNTIVHAPPKSVHPIFFGSFDWHSCVHSYWLLATILRMYPRIGEAPAIAALFAEAFAKEVKPSS